MDVGMMMVFASYGWDDCSDERVWNEEIRLARLAADLGFDCLWSAEHHFNDYSFVPDNLALMTHLTALCPDIDVGTAAVILPWHDPLRVAENAAVLDMLSKGRLRLGLGRGLARREFAAFRLSMDESRGRFDEAAPMIVNALKTGFMEGDGKYLQAAAHRDPAAAAALVRRPHLRRGLERGLGRLGRQARRPYRDVHRPAVGDARAADRARPHPASQVPRHRAAHAHADRVLRLRHQLPTSRTRRASTRASSSRAISITTSSWASTSRR